jgi:type VI secretion system secreted protein VgrG
MSDSFVINCGALPEGTRVMGFRGVEAISKPYCFEIYVSVHRGLGDTVDLDDALGSRVALEVVRHVDLLEMVRSTPFRFQGIVSALELVNEMADRTVLRVTMVPQLWRLGQSIHSRIFTKLSVPDMLSEVLTEAGFGAEDFELRLSGDYPPEEHVCQYKESDLAFLSRWMEREGMFYFFEHGDGAEKLVITDDKSVHEALAPAPIRYHPAVNDESQKGCLQRVSLRRTSVPATVQLKDYDYAKPALNVAGAADVSSAGLGEVVLYGERFFTPDQGKRLAQLRAETFRAGQDVLSSSGSVHHLRSGYTFELEQHPRPALNQSYLVTKLEHVGRGLHGDNELDALLGQGDNEVYRVKLEAIPASVQYRAERATPWPRIHCFENAIVDGAANSTYAQIDPQGRYAIKFHFDESNLKLGKASTFVRMAQPHGGSVEGFHFPLRKGTEVLVTFLGGDPDRPVIAGVLPNAATPSPISSANNTKNVLQTGGSTRIEIEDQSGGQYMKQFTPVANTMLWMGTDATSPQGHNVELSTDGSGFQSFGTYLDQFVGGTKSEHVVGAVTRTYDATYSTTVAADVTETYQASQTTTVTGDVSRTIHGTLTENVAGAVSQTYQSTYGLSVTGDVTQVFKAAHGLEVTSDQSIVVTGATTHQFDAGLDVTVNAAVSSHTANVGYELEVQPTATMHASANFDIRGDATAKISAPATTVHGDTSVVVNGGSTITIGPTNILINGTEVITLSGPALIEILGGDITISGGNVNVAAGGTINQTAAGAFTMAGAGTQIDGGPVVDVHGGLIKLNC